MKINRLLKVTGQRSFIRSWSIRGISTTTNADSILVHSKKTRCMMNEYCSICLGSSVTYTGYFFQKVKNETA